MAVNTPRGNRKTTPPQLTETDLAAQKQELGAIGRLLGSREHAPVYIAGGIGIVSLVGAILISILEPSSEPFKGDTIKSLMAIVLAVITFIGGVSSRGK